MNNIIQQIEKLALYPDWDGTVIAEKSALLPTLSDAERAQLKEKIICFVYIPDPEKPDQEAPLEPEQPEPEQDNDTPFTYKKAI